MFSNLYITLFLCIFVYKKTTDMSKLNQQINLELLAAFLNNMPDADKEKLYAPVKDVPKKKPKKGVSAKGRITKSHSIDFDKAYNSALRMKGTKNENFGFYIVVAIHTGLRIGDILKLKRKNFEDGVYQLREQKTGKAKTLPFNKKVLEYFNELRNKSEIVFRSNKGTTFCSQTINRKIKQTFQAKNKNYSSHSLRKSFGRKVYEMNNCSEDALVSLSEIYNHTDLRVTRTYLDITQEKLDSIYLGI